MEHRSHIDRDIVGQPLPVAWLRTAGGSACPTKFLMLPVCC